ncbi:unnamed protein product [Camellia sinensis]
MTAYERSRILLRFADLVEKHNENGELDISGQQTTESLHCSRRSWRRERFAHSLGLSSFHRRRRWPELWEVFSAREHCWEGLFCLVDHPSLFLSVSF